MIKAGIESVSMNVGDFDDFLDSSNDAKHKKPVVVH
jgi:hypothetical protein